MDKYPILFEGKAIVITSKEKEFLDCLMKTGSIEDAANESGIDVGRAREFLDTNRMKEYVISKVEQMARRNDITLDTVLDRLHRIAFGEIKPGRYEMKALEVLSHYLNIIKPVQHNTLNVNVQENPLEKKTDAQLDDMIRTRIGHDKPEA